MNSSDRLTDNEIAFAAMNLFANKPKGPEPDWQEIHDWHMELLDEARSEEVLSHVANNPDVFQKWRDICEAAEFLEQNPLENEQTSNTDAHSSSKDNSKATSANPAPWDLAGWLGKGMKSIIGKPLPAIGGAVAATFLAVMIVPKLLTSPAANPGDMINASLSQYSALGAPLPQTALPARSTRSLAGVLGDLTKEDIERHQINHGLRTAFDAINGEQVVDNLNSWLPWQESLPESAVDCTLATDQQHCTQISADMKTLGQWALLNHLACESNTSVSSEFVQQQSNTFSAIKKLKSLETSQLVTAELLNSNNAGEHCALALNLIEIASE